MAKKKTHPADEANLALVPLCTKFAATLLSKNKHIREEHGTLQAARAAAAKMEATAKNGKKALVYAIGKSGASILVPADYQLPTEADVLGDIPAFLKRDANNESEVRKQPSAAQEARAKREVAKTNKAVAAAAEKAARMRAEIKAERATAKPSAAKEARAKREVAKINKAVAKAAATQPTTIETPKETTMPKKTAKTKTSTSAPQAGTKAEIAYKMLTRKAGATRKAIVEACDGWGIDLKQFAERKGLKLKQDDDGVWYGTAKA